MKKTNKYQKAVTAYFVAMFLFWAYLFLTHHNSQGATPNYWFSFLFGLMPLLGGLAGMIKASVWGGLRSALGKAVFFVSLGLFLWGFGESIWSYYNFFKGVPAPYPSLADIGFAPSIFFWILGTAYLSKATGAWFVLKKSRKAKLLTFAVPVILLLPSYYLQIHVAKGGVLVPGGETVLKAVLDVAYPFGDFLALTFAALVAILSYRYFGGIYRRAVYYLLAGLAVMYCADSVFSYTTTKETYYNADWGDMMLTAGLYLITVGILAFASKPGDPGKDA